MDSDAKPKGDPEIMVKGARLTSLDIAGDGTIYASAHKADQILKITQKLEVTTLAEGGLIDLISSMAIRRTAGKLNTLYLAAKFVADDPGAKDDKGKSRIISVELR